ncbi:MAG: hypothetical protein PHI97_06295 [Desulfobulbus sp.]|nr:hypothetical protein [Desulfobulbus sp.]
MKTNNGIIVLILCLLIAGCAGDTATKPQGQWLEEEGIQKSIEAGTVYHDHNYYYLGSITAPDSFIAVDKRWRLQTRVWAEVTMSQQRLAGWLQWYRSEHYGGCEYRAGRILAPDGSPVGYWYSQNPINTIYILEPGVIQIYKPHNIAGQVCGEPRDDGFFHGSD